MDKATELAQKNLKGFLLQNDVEFDKIHDLIKILEQCKSVDTSFLTILPQCSVLNRYSVIPRYPDEFEITVNDTSNAIQYAKDIRDFVNMKKQADKTNERQ